MSSERSNVKKMTAKDILEMINKYLPVREHEKNENGEVFTPVELIDEMLDALPKKVWKNPNLKWLDPANGIGNFPLVIYQRLLKGLKKAIPDENERKEHILANMLYMVEKNPKNVIISKRIFGKTANIACGSFLDDEWKNKFKIDTFDIIIGNPPFNKNQEAVGKKGGGDPLWPAFVKRSLELVKKHGYLVFVHPAAWRKPESEKSKSKGLFDLMTHQHKLLHLEIYNTTAGFNTFGCGTRYDWYVLHNKTSEDDVLTTVKDEKGVIHNMNLNEWSFLPNYNFNMIKKLLNKHGKSVEVIYSATQYETRKKWVSEEKTKEYKYPLIHSTPKTGPRYIWTSTKNPNVANFIPMFGVSKVIFGESGINDVIIDIDGKYATTQEAIALKVETLEEAKLVKTALESTQFQEIITAMSFGNYRIDWRMFTYFKKDFYKYFINK